MNKFFSKLHSLVAIFLIVFFVGQPLLVRAVGDQPFYNSEKESKNVVNTANIITKIGSSTIVNRSDKDLFVPNKTAIEYESWYNNAPIYVSVSVCGRGGCEDGEDVSNCPEDCSSPKYCGDGICSQSNIVYASTTPLAYITNYKEVCKKKKGWLSIVGGFIAGGIVTVATGGIGAGIGAGIIAGILIPGNTNCDMVPDGQTPKYELSVITGEVYTKDNNSQYVTQTECKADCMPPSGSGCGSCGYDVNGNLCSNYCSNRGYNMINCKYYPPSVTTPNSNGTLQSIVKRKTLKEYLTANEALAIAANEASSPSGSQEGYYYSDSGYYGCDFGASESTYYCPAGTYCPYTGGMKTGTAVTSYVTTTWLSAQGLTLANVQPKTCPAGYFCPAGSFYTRPCPINTFSTGGAAKCTACVAGTGTGGNSAVTSESYCQAAFKNRDGVCNRTGSINENPVSSSFDCPDSSHLAIFKGDGRCTGIETMENSPNDCKCGDGICNNSETYLSCLPDCGCMDSVCGTVKYTYTTSYIRNVFPEGNKCNSYGNQVANKSICKYMNDGEVCGDGTCSPGEGYRYIQDLDGVYRNKIVCPLDCHCGDNSCSSTDGENWNWTTNTGTCKLDCKCGNNTCDSNESSYSCPTDCHCGNNKCETEYGETPSSCSSDCRCGDSVCSYGESCTSDCGSGTGECGDGVCGYMEYIPGKRTKETLGNCPDDCGQMQLQ